MTRGTTVVFEAGGDAAVSPASAIKLLTAASVLDVLGPEARYRTAARAATQPDNGTVAGDVWLVGAGDPMLGTTAWAAHEDIELFTSLDALADGLVAIGVRRINGRIVGDETRYDSLRSVDTWPRRFVTDGEVGPLSALTVNDGFQVWGHPGEPFDDPAVGAASLFTELLRARGVDIGEEPAAGSSPVGLELAAVESPPVGDIVTEMLRDSDNGTAELLVKELGVRRRGDGSTAAGVTALTETLEAREVSVAHAIIADGSGLSAADRVSCRLLAEVLVAHQEALYDRLAVAGRTGTLRRRFKGTQIEGRLRAKTGSLDGVAAIAGYVDTIAGERLSFAYVINGLEPPASGSAEQDELVRLLVESRP